MVAAPIIREVNGDTTGGLTVQNVDDTETIIYFEYYEYGTDNVYVLRTTVPLDPFAAISTNQLYRQNDGDKFTIVSGFSDFSELAGKQFSVIAYSESGGPIFGLASEYSINQVLDMRNYEAINFSD